MEGLIASIDKNKIPTHIAITMDGNGRWAKQKGKPRSFGHKNGVKSVKDTLRACQNIGVEYLTLFAFSSENWNRPKDEVNTLMTLLVTNLRKEFRELNEKGIRLKAIGNLDKIPSKVRKELEDVINKTQNNTKGTLVVALSYGSKEEIIQATQKIAQKVQDNEMTIEDINPETFSAYLYTEDIPDVDLLIRTSGEYRISNFLLWQIAYAELYFTETLWPDFNEEELYKAVLAYQKRERRFGKISEQLLN